MTIDATRREDVDMKEEIDVEKELCDALAHEISKSIDEILVEERIANELGYTVKYKLHEWNIPVGSEPYAEYNQTRRTRLEKKWVKK